MGDYLTDVEALMTGIIEDNWDTSSGIPIPYIYYSTTEEESDGEVRGARSHDYYDGSAMFITQGPLMMGQITSIDYNSVNREIPVYITLRGYKRAVIYAQGNELINVFMRVRRNIDGFEYLEMGQPTFRHEYINFYRLNIDIRLKSVTQPIEEDGLT